MPVSPYECNGRYRLRRRNESSMAANNQIKQFSSSWFLASYGRVDPTADQIYQEMITQGQSFFQASGDTDAWCGANWWPADNHMGKAHQPELPLCVALHGGGSVIYFSGDLTG